MEKIIKQITTMKEVVEDVEFWKTDDGLEFQTEREAYLHENEERILADFMHLMSATNQYFKTKTGFIVYAYTQQGVDLVKDRLSLDGYSLAVGEYPTTFPCFINIHLIPNNFGRLIYSVNTENEYDYAKELVDFVNQYI